MSAPRVRPNLSQRQRLRLSQGLTASIRILRLDASGLARYLEDQAAENPFLRLDPPVVPAGDWLPRWTGTFLPGAGNSLEAAAPDGSLLAHVTAEVLRLFPRGRLRELAMALAGALSPAGWLDRPLAAIAAEAGASLAEIEPVLTRLQRIDPPGLFARSLAECLELQAREAGWHDDVFAVILANLRLVAAGDFAQLARLARSDTARIEAHLKRLRTLDPKPGARFEHGAAPAREPDLIARREGETWTVVPNRAALPVLSVAAPRRGTADDAARQRLAEARALRRQLAARSATLCRVAAELLRRQSEALRHGPQALKPLTMAEVAGALRLHPATISRAVAGTSVDTTEGAVWLRRLFGPALPDGTAGAAARARLAEIIAAEDPRRPHSDARLAALLAASGPGAPTRRTVAKYRMLLGLPPAHLRRRAAPPGA